MATSLFNTRLRSDSDATFREWVAEFGAQLQAVGLVRTADTGQINPATVTRPVAVSTDAGYEIFRFNDALQATAPIFLRVNYGTGTSLNAPRLTLQVGTGTNGAGTLTGLTTTARQIHPAGSSQTQTTDTARASYLCGLPGFVGLLWKAGSGSDAFFAISRTVDSGGAPTGDGALVAFNTTGGGLATRAFRFASPATAFPEQTSQTSAMLCFLPQNPGSTLANADFSVAVCYSAIPEPVVVPQLLGVYDAELPFGVTISHAVIGATARTYVGLRVVDMCQPGPGTGAAFPKFAMLWE